MTLAQEYRAPLEVYVVKEEGPTRQALTSLLTSAGISSRTFDTASAFLETCAHLPPSCVITSFQTRGVEVLEFLRRLSEQQASFPAIIITSGGGVMQAVKAMKAGAANVVEWPHADEVLLGAVRSALEVDPRAAAQTAQRRAFATLTRREHDVLGGMMDGKTNKMIARHLGISPRTVEVYRASMMKKAGVNSFPGLVKLATGY